MASSSESTLYPKITTHITEIVKTLKELSYEQHEALDPMPIVGTVKLHGTHADIVIHHDDSIIFQSRNVVGLNTEKDNAGFAAAMSKKVKPLLRLRDVIVGRFTQLNPTTPLDRNRPIIIAGEWIGESVQKGVAIARLSKRFVIISVNVNGIWQKDNDYSAIALPNHDIYNVSRAGLFKKTLHPQDISRTISELEAVTEQIAHKCPFAETFGIEGEGEGIVWKLACDPYNANPALWFKTKGGRFKPTFARALRQCSEVAEHNREVAAGLAKTWCSEQRMDQGLEYLREMDIGQDSKALTPFLKWVQNDIMVEERALIAQHKVDGASLRIEVAKIAKPWYMARMRTE